MLDPSIVPTTGLDRVTLIGANYGPTGNPAPTLFQDSIPNYFCTYESNNVLVSSIRPGIGNFTLTVAVGSASSTTTFSYSGT